jgi:hypothetical protein
MFLASMRSKLRMKITVCWDIAPCNQVEFDQHFRSVYCLHRQDDKLALREKEV